MRSTLIAVASAALALAGPIPNEDVVTKFVTDVEVVTVTLPKGWSNYRNAHGFHSQHPSPTPAADAPATTTTSPPVFASPDPGLKTDPETDTKTPTMPAAKIANTAEVSGTTTTPAAAAQQTPAAAAPPASGSGSSSGSSSGSLTTATTYQDAVVLHHNLCKANHNSPAATWDDDMYNSALQIAETCIYGHVMNVGNVPYGQNIAAGVRANNISNIITDMFYLSEEPFFAGLYGQESPDMSNFGKWGHFSQVVWKASTGVACASVDCGSNLKIRDASGNVTPMGNMNPPYNTFTVCNYATPGNVAGEYGDNIGALAGTFQYSGDSLVNPAAILSDWQSTPAGKFSASVDA